MKYFFLHGADGCIVNAGQCQDSDFELQAQPGLTLVEGQACPFADYFDAGVKAKPVRPADYMRFDYATKTWLDTRTLDDQWRAVRRARDGLLQASDWSVVRATEAGQATAPQWRTYRQALRDITAQADPFNITWPASPP